MQKRRYQKSLTEEEYQIAIAEMKITDQTKDITRAVLVLGKPQVEQCKKYNVSKGAVSLACRRVWESHITQKNPELVKIEGRLPRHRAYIVNKWIREAQKKF